MTLPTCPHCRPGPETYRYLGRYEFDVDAARGLVADGREPVEVDDASVRYWLEDSKLHDQHLDHVDPRFPGILAHVWFNDGIAEHHGHALIDGNHRAARCLRDGRPFFARLLTEAESRAVLTDTAS
ncbi:hypothetical protein [Limnoglobus roseus]|uniref:Uncharacterized protein n=1 Tax=Limnoglobus roseus TaxID=2598579 RepID=A0A5C1A9Q3_9BACT|nr:hypothetical protein [Limnoglobus roseus]QEL15460.1 hypothetical protein PX52LOC_02380 [Limnoglobus roseus]